MPARGGVWSRGVSQHALRQTPPRGQTDRCKNITFATSLRTVIKKATPDKAIGGLWRNLAEKLKLGWAAQTLTQLIKIAKFVSYVCKCRIVQQKFKLDQDMESGFQPSPSNNHQTRPTLLLILLTFKHCLSNVCQIFFQYLSMSVKVYQKAFKTLQ